MQCDEDEYFSKQMLLTDKAAFTREDIRKSNFETKFSKNAWVDIISNKKF